MTTIRGWTCPRCGSPDVAMIRDTAENLIGIACEKHLDDAVEKARPKAGGRALRVRWFETGQPVRRVSDGRIVE